MMQIILAGRIFWMVNGVIYTTRRAAVEAYAGSR